MLALRSAAFSNVVCVSRYTPDTGSKKACVKMSVNNVYLNFHS